MTKEKPFSFDSLSDVHDEIQEKSPAPSDAAIAAHVDEAVAQEQVNAALVDSAGTQFDPEQHAVTRDDEPSLTTTGKFRRKRGLSKVLTQSQAVQDERDKVAARAAGYLAADLTIHSAIMLGGPEWTPIGSKEMSPDGEFNEHENLRRAFGDYFEAKGISDFPPGLGLSLAMAGYMLPRFTAGEETRSRLSKAKAWLGEAWKKMKRGKKDASQPDSRDNGKRKDDTSETTSTPVDDKTARSDSP